MLVIELVVFCFIDGKMWFIEIVDGCDLVIVCVKIEVWFEVVVDLNM